MNDYIITMRRLSDAKETNIFVMADSESLAMMEANAYVGWRAVGILALGESVCL